MKGIESITRGYNAGTITRGCNAGTRDYDSITGTRDYDSITRSYNTGTRGYDGITRSYDSITRSYRREREGVATIGLDWLLGVLLGGWRGLGGIPAGLVFLAWPSRPLSPHPTSPNSLSSPPPTSI